MGLGIHSSSIRTSCSLFLRAARKGCVSFFPLFIFLFFHSPLLSLSLPFQLSLSSLSFAFFTLLSLLFPLSVSFFLSLSLRVVSFCSRNPLWNSNNAYKVGSLFKMPLGRPRASYLAIQQLNSNRLSVSLSRLGHYSERCFYLHDMMYLSWLLIYD